MKTGTKLILIASVIASSIGMASAQTTNFYAPGQGFVGSAVRSGSTTNFYAPGQGFVGSAVTSGSSTNYYAPGRGFIGSAVRY